MTFQELAHTMRYWGYEIAPKEYYNFGLYLYTMMHRNRVMVIKNNGELDAIIMFHLTNDYTKLYKKGLWDIPQDEPDGSQIYIDKMVCRHWTSKLRRKIQEIVKNCFPNVKVAYWHRAPFDRCVKAYVYRRNQCIA